MTATASEFELKPTPDVSPVESFVHGFASRIVRMVKRPPGDRFEMRGDRELRGPLSIEYRQSGWF